MAKRKNPLKNLDEFLKQEATSFVTPEKIAAPPPEEKGLLEAEPKTSEPLKTTSKADILAALETLAQKEGGDFRTSFYSIIRETLEKLDQSTSEDKMLINTLLYLNNKPEWKDEVRNYWSRTA